MADPSATDTREPYAALPFTLGPDRCIDHLASGRADRHPSADASVTPAAR
jgi:hypothetical protein